MNHHGGANNTNGYYFLLASAVGMIRPMDVTPLDADTLVLLETDYPQACDTAPQELIKDPTSWILVDKFCFFSGGPINIEEDVYYEADLDGNGIYMLAFLSPNLTPNELYKLNDDDDQDNGGAKDNHGATTANHNTTKLDTTAAVLEVERVYDLTERDFDDLKLYHLGPCRALYVYIHTTFFMLLVVVVESVAVRMVGIVMSYAGAATKTLYIPLLHRPPYILQPQAWSKVLPPPFLVAKGEALRRARQTEIRAGIMMDDDDDADTHPYDDNDNHDGSILMMNQQQQQKHRQMSYDAGDSPMYDDGVDDDRTDEPFDQHPPPHHHPQPKSTTTDSYRSFEPPNVKYDPYDRFSAPATTAAASRTRGSIHHYSQPYEPAPPPPSSSSMRHGGGRMEPPDGNDRNETDPVVFSRQQHDHQHPQQRHLPQQQPHVRHAPPLHQIPLGSSSNYAPPPPSASSSPYSDYHHHDYRRPDPKVLHSSGMDPPEDEPPSLRKASMSASSSRYNNVGESSQQHPITSAEESSDDQYTEPFAEPHESYEPVDEYYDNEGRMEYPEYEPLDFAEDSPVTAQSDYHHYRQHHHQQAHLSHHHPVVVTSPTASDGDFTDPTIGTFSPRRGGSGLPPTSPTRSQYSQNSALANEVLRRSSRTKQQPHHGPEYTNDVLTPLSQPSASTWETDGTSEFSSVWTENEPDRTSRRALILQMAKARMKNNTSTTTAGSTASTGNGSGYVGKSSSSHYHPHQHEVEDEKKLGDVDLRGDLD
jgi:hypothetical protein